MGVGKNGSVGAHYNAGTKTAFDPGLWVLARDRNCLKKSSSPKGLICCWSWVLRDRDSASIRTTAGELLPTTSAYDVRTPSTTSGAGGALGSV